MGPSQGSNSLLGRFLGCLQMTFYFLSEKQNRIYNLTAKTLRVLPVLLHLLSVLAKALEPPLQALVRENPKASGTGEPFSESRPRLKVSLATQRDVTCGAEPTEPVLAPPRAFFLCPWEVPSSLTREAPHRAHSSCFSHLPLRSTLIAPTISSGQYT